MSARRVSKKEKLKSQQQRDQILAVTGQRVFGSNSGGLRARHPRGSFEAHVSRLLSCGGSCISTGILFRI